MARLAIDAILKHEEAVKSADVAKGVSAHKYCPQAIEKG